jgi:hypothetical protein
MKIRELLIVVTVKSVSMPHPLLWRIEMPVYPIINKETGEQKELTLSLEQWDEFKISNPQWIRDWSDPSTAPNSAELGEWRDKLNKAHPSWNEVLKKSKKSAGMNSKMETL